MTSKRVYVILCIYLIPRFSALVPLGIKLMLQLSYFLMVKAL